MKTPVTPCELYDFKNLCKRPDPIPTKKIPASDNMYIESQDRSCTCQNYIFFLLISNVYLHLFYHFST